MGLAVVAFHGPRYRSALGTKREAQGAHSHQTSVSPREFVFVIGSTALCQLRTAPGRGSGLSVHCSVVAETSAFRITGRCSENEMAKLEPSPLAAWLRSSASCGQLAGPRRVVHRTKMKSPYRSW